MSVYMVFSGKESGEMTETEAIARSSAGRGRVALALFAAAAALVGGAQAFVPTRAAAMIDMGSDCANLSGSALFECEMRGAGAGGGSGGSGGGGPSTGGTGGDQIIGEPIYVEGTLPPPRCTICLPSQIGGGRLGFSDRGVRNPRERRHRGRHTRVGEVAKEKAKDPTRADCERFKAGQLQLPADAEMKAVEARLGSTIQRQADQEGKLGLLREEAARIDLEVQSMKNSHQVPAKRIRAAEERLGSVMGNILGVGREISATMNEFIQLTKAHGALRVKKAAEAQALQKQCRALYGLGSASVSRR
jgi:hypothetical protein